MENLPLNTIALLQYLLPGFLAAWVFYGFTSFEKPSQFERVIQALIFMLFIQIFLFLIKSLLVWFGWYPVTWEAQRNSELIASFILALLIGFVFAWLANKDYFHSLIRKFGITKETSYPSEWFGEFSSGNRYITLHLFDGRRIYGWPKEWPSSPEKGHFMLIQAAWLDEENEEIPLKGVETILIAAKDVKMVEFVANPER